MLLETEAAVIANFEFLRHTDMDMEEEEGDVEDEIYDANTDTKPNKVNFFSSVTLYFYPIILRFMISFTCDMCALYRYDFRFRFTGIYSSSNGGR